MSSDIPTTDDTLKGTRYEIRGKLGAGATASVYVATDRLLDRNVALKVISGEMSSVAIERLRQEALIGQRLIHPHIVRTFGIERLEEEAIAIVMVHVEGDSAAARLEAGRRFPLEELLSLFRAVAGALAYAHGEGIVHRDIKPSNVLLGNDGSIKLSDFGSAAIVDELRSMHPTATLVGTPAFMAPEVAAGQRADERSDVYSLGLLILALHTGAPLRRAPHGRSVPIPESLPPALRRVLRCCTENSPADRYPDAGAVAEALRDLAVVSRRSAVGRLVAGAAAGAAGLLFLLVAVAAICQMDDTVLYYTVKSVLAVERTTGLSLLKPLVERGMGKDRLLRLHHSAQKYGDLDVVEAILPDDLRALPAPAKDELGWTVCVAVEKQRMDLLRMLINAGIALDSYCMYRGDFTFAMDIAITEHNLEAVRLIGPAGLIELSPDMLTPTTLDAIKLSQDRDIVRLLLSWIESKPTKMWQELILSAVARANSHDPMLLEEIRARNVDFNMIAVENGKSVLSLFAERCQGGAIETLLGVAGVDPNVLDTQRRTPLFGVCSECAECGQLPSVFDHLAGAGADLNARDSASLPLVVHFAANRNERLLENLLRFPRVDVNAAAPNGTNALHTAAARGLSRNVRLLLEHGADPALRDSYGRDALAFADSSGDASTIALLRNARSPVENDASSAESGVPR